MQLISKTVEYSSVEDRFRFVTIGDTHLGALAADEEALDRTLRNVQETENCFLLLMGDQCDYIARNDPRFDSGGLADWVPTQKLSTIGKVQLDYAVAKFEPVKDKILVALEGNHEQKFTHHYGFDVHELFCNALGVESGGYCAKVDVRFMHSKGPETRVLPIFTHHGFGGGRKSGSKVNNIQDFRADHDARVYLMGHVHECGWAPMKPYMYTTLRKGVQELKVRYRHFGLTGPYLKSYIQGHSTYSERAAYPPTAIGSIYWDYYPRLDRFKEHTVEEHGEFDG